MNTTTRRHPRTLQEAFGPYASSHIAEPAPRMSRSEKALYAVALIALAVIYFVR